MELCAVKLCAVLIVSWVFAMHVEAVEFCGVPLGMEDGRIPDSSITASSTFTPTTCLTRNARLNNPGSPWTESGWCPSNSDRTNPWLQVDLQRPTKIEGVIMQGVVGGLGVTAYQVQYSNNQTGWRYVGQNEMGSGIVETFRTNVGSSGPPVTHLFPSPVKARYIRIRPTEYNLLPAIRMELIGCQVLDCPSNITQFAEISSTAVPVSWEEPPTADSLPWNATHRPGDLFPVGSVTEVAYTAQNDEEGSFISCSFTVAVTGVDITCPGNVSVSTNVNNFANVSWPLPRLRFSGVNPDVRVISNYEPGQGFTIGTTLVTYRIPETKAECQFYVSVLDNQPPVIRDCPDDVIVPVNSSSGQLSVSWSPPSISDNSGRDIQLTFKCRATTPTECNEAGEGTFSVGITTVIYKAQDQSGIESVCQFTVNVTVVNLACPQNVTVTPNPGSSRASVSWPEPILTGWDGPTNVASNFNPGDMFSIGAEKVVYRHRFEAFSFECSFFVQVLDNEPPEINGCPDDVIIPVGSSSSRVPHVWTPPLITDQGEVNVSFSCQALAPTECYQAGDGIFSEGITIVMYKAQDQSGNENVCRFVIEVTVVNLVCPANVTAFANPGSTRTSVNWMEPDLIGWNRPTNLTSSANPGAVFMIGTHRVSYQQWFGEYNLRLGCSFFIVVVDNQPPVITSCPNDIIVPVNSSSSQQSVSWFPPSISDNSGRDIEVTLDCLATAPTECNEAGEGTFSVGNTTVIYKAQDQSGTESICQFTVIVKVANFVCPPNVTVTLNPGSSRTSASWPQPVLAGWDGPTNVTSNFKPGDMFTIGTEKVDYRSSFELYNFQCSFFVHVLDIEPPEIISCPDDVIIPVGSSSSWVPHVWTPPLITDQGEVNVLFICQALAPIECNQAGSGTFSEGVNTVMYKAQDQSGNENVCRFVIQVTVVDLVCPENMTALANPGSKRSSVNWMEPDLTGWNGPTNLTSSANPGSVFMIGTHRVSYQQWFAAYELGLDCSFSVMVVGRCPSNSTSDGLRWPAVTAGSTAKSVQRCALTTAKAGQPLAVRNCSIENPPIFFQWEEPEPRSCGEAKNEVSLDNVARVDVSEGNVVEVAEFLANQTSESTKDAENVGAVSAILVNVVSTRSGNKEVAELVVQTVSNVIKSTETTADSKTPDINAGNSSAIIRSVEAQVSLTLRKEGKVSIRQDKVHVEAVSLDPEKASGGFSFVSARQAGQELPRDGSLGGAEVNTFFDTKDIPADIEVVASVRLPGNIADSIYPSDGNNSVQLQASFLIYADDTLFQSASLRKYRGENNSTRKVAGSVVSLTVENVELVNLTEPLVIEFKTPNNVTDEELQTIQCVSWDFNLEDGVGDWSPAGCERAGLTADKMSCDCYHATNFAVLLDVKGQVPEDTPEKKALDVISQVGCALSIVALAVTLIIYLSIRKLRSGISRQIFIHFCFSLLMLYIVFLAGIDNAKGSGGGCVFVAALLHYLTLSTMMWMAVEARNMYISTVKVFPEDRPRYMLKACLIAWAVSCDLVLCCTLVSLLPSVSSSSITSSPSSWSCVVS
ncbi:hyalin-like isoform X2 [Acanthaster planci]|uniref:Hyalin-like isoform X2 n=1 Tax=Acanthaster planci TaxID=133434 RepID=A0A8B7ZME2_ACAPL|nr:hyalin-like isoform X2 [Acanthaster planci]